MARTIILSPMEAGCTFTGPPPRSRSALFQENSARYGGGGAFLYSSVTDVSDSTFLENAAQDAAGVYIDSATARFSRCRFEDNQAEYLGGAFYLVSSRAELTNCILRRNHAGWEGGGLVSHDSMLSMERVDMLENSTMDSSGALAVAHSDLTMRWCVVSGNVAVEDPSETSSGGGITIEGGSARIEHCEILNNDATAGGGIYLDARYYPFEPVALELTGSIVAYNRGGNVVAEPSDFDPAGILWNDLYNPEGTPNHNLSGLDPSNLAVEPGFLSYGADGLPADLRLALDSSLVDSGAPDGTDLDGSREDIGIYGGAGGALWDRDQDGFQDWFWPGTIEDAPDGFSPADYDWDDRDPFIY